MTQLVHARPSAHRADGLTTLATATLLLGGVGQAATGLLTMLNDALFAIGRDSAVLTPAAWGVLHLSLGAALAAAALGLRAEAPWARPLGVVAGLAAIVASFLWGAYSPVVSTALVAVTFTGLWAMSAAGADGED